jgi:hypothetical protein
MREYLATSLDGWIVMRYADDSGDERSVHSDSDGSAVSIERRKYNCGLEIKTPSSKKIIQETVKKGLDFYGPYSQCEFGSCAFTQLVYKPEYRTQVLHHATIANLKYVLFVVAGTTKIHYAVLIRFPEVKLTIMRGILAGIYQRSLKWAYTSATVSPLSIIPTFCEEVISSITTDCIVFSWIIWKHLMRMVLSTMLPLPKAHKIMESVEGTGRRNDTILRRNGFPFCKRNS